MKSPSLHQGNQKKQHERHCATILKIDCVSLCANSMNRPRDMALVEKIECTRDGAIMFACTSVETPRVPRIQGRVRAQIKVKLLFYASS